MINDDEFQKDDNNFLEKIGESSLNESTASVDNTYYGKLGMI